MKVEKRLEELQITLPNPPVPMASYVAYKISGDMLYISGQGPMIDGKPQYVGKAGKDISFDDACQSARLCGLNLIALMKSALGDLDRVEEIIHLKGFVSCDADFADQPKVINGASDLMVEVFGKAGAHTRCALGTNSLPANIPVEVEAIVKVR